MKTNVITTSVHLPSPFPKILWLNTVIQYGITLWSVQVSCPSCISCQPLALTQPTHWVDRERKQKKIKENLDAVQAWLSNRQNSSVLSTLWIPGLSITGRVASSWCWMAWVVVTPDAYLLPWLAADTETDRLLVLKVQPFSYSLSTVSSIMLKSTFSKLGPGSSELGAKYILFFFYIPHLCSLCTHMCQVPNSLLLSFLLVLQYGFLRSPVKAIHHSSVFW